MSNYEPKSLFDTKGWILAMAIIDTIIVVVWVGKPASFLTYAVSVLFTLFAMYNWNRLWKIRKGL